MPEAVASERNGKNQSRKHKMWGYSAGLPQWAGFSTFPVEKRQWGITFFLAMKGVPGDSWWGEVEQSGVKVSFFFLFMPMVGDSG
jgi:hypothetical protein